MEAKCKTTKVFVELEVGDVVLKNLAIAWERDGVVMLEAVGDPNDKLVCFDISRHDPLYGLFKFAQGERELMVVGGSGKVFDRELWGGACRESYFDRRKDELDARNEELDRRKVEIDRKVAELDRRWASLPES